MIDWMRGKYGAASKKMIRAATIQPANVERRRSDGTRQNRVADRARHRMRTSAASFATYGRMMGKAASGGSRLRVEINSPRAAADSGRTYALISTTSATSRAPSPANENGS
jgi:hypothetical protein